MADAGPKCCSQVSPARSIGSKGNPSARTIPAGYRPVAPRLLARAGGAYAPGVETAGERAARLDAVLVGGRERVEIVVVDPDPAWPARFQAVRDRLRAALGDRALGIEHIGSTAVPGLAAKPIIDVLLTVAAVDDEAAYAGAVEGAGFLLRVRE